MIPQSLTSPTFLKNEFWDGSDKTLTKYNNNNNNLEKVKGKNESEESIVQWKQKNIKDGFVIVDEAQLTKLIKRKPIEKFYKLEKEPFATGVFASVRRCQSLETGESYAAKFTSRDRYGEDCSAEIYHEIALLSLCGSAARVIQIHDVFETEKEIIIVMEYAPGGDLQTIIDENLVPFESDVMSFIRQTVEGLEYLHRRRIAHLDIKARIKKIHHTPQNIVMMGDYPNCEIKLCDFEISRVILDGKDIRELLGTPEYVAPEILHYDPITLAADMWSLGVTTYVLLTGFSPFGGDTDQETFCNISRAEVDFPEELFKDVSNEAIDFIKSLLIKNPKARLTASECLKHPWFNMKHEQKKIEDEKKPNTLIIDNVKEEAEEEKMYKGKNGCETCREQKQDAVETNQQNDKSLRKYLSKSREALFDKVVQKHNTNTNINNRKNTIKNYRFRKNRLCKSQYSLISKSQEKLLAGETFNVPPSRSIEKLYGLRSLSKSQEVLNLYKNGGLLASQENLNMVSELIKSRENLLSGHDVEEFKEKKLTRATTADLSILHQRHKPLRMYSCSSTISLSSYIHNPPEEEQSQENDSVFEKCNTSEYVETETKTDNRVTEKEKEKEKEKHEEKSSAIRDGKLEKRINSGKKAQDEGDEDEPRFTVAQLITAYNKHQEIVTKTSLEVTMSAQEKETKIPPLIPYKSKSSFPTGPTALRLFIPDIDVVEMPKKFFPKYKMRFPEAIEEIKERSPSPKETKDSPLQYLNLNSIISSNESISAPPAEDCRNFQKDYKTKKCEAQQPEENKKHLTPGYTHKRSKSSSPHVEIIRVDPIPKLNSTGNLNSQKCDDLLKRRSPTPSRKASSGRIHEKSPNPSRKSLSVEKSPVVQRKTVAKTSKPTSENVCKRGESWNYKIVGYGEKNVNPNRKSSAISYKIEFDSPVARRKFPPRNIPTKGTISSNLKVKETRNKMKKPT